MKLYTHVSPDLDAVCSVWAARQFIGGAASAELEFRPANWDGSGMDEGDLALDLDAGGRGIKGRHEPDGRVHSCFADIVSRYATVDDRAAITELVEFVDAQDTYGSAVKHLAPEINSDAKKVLAVTGLNAVFRALQAMHPRDDFAVFKLMFEILNGLIKTGRARLRAEKEADNAEPCGPYVAIVRHSEEFGTNAVLFERGVRAIVYVDGNNLGVIRRDGISARMNDLIVRSVVQAAGEANEWFAHPAGFLYCRGSRKSPKDTPSKVNPLDLARAVAILVS